MAGEQRIRDCPFCGSTLTDGEMSDVAVRRITIGGNVHWNAHMGEFRYYVTCYCGACGPVARSLKAAVDRWNEAIRLEEE